MSELTTRQELVRIHPVNLLASQAGNRAFALVAFGGVALSLVLLLSAAGASDAATVAALVAAGLLAFAPEPEPTTQEDREQRLQQAADAYASGRLSHAEFEQRAEYILDDRNVQIRRRVEGAEGVGPVRSAALATHFPDVDALLAADVDDLAGAHGVGQQVAQNVADHVRRQAGGLEPAQPRVERAEP